jgi:hypothetical protein
MTARKAAEEGRKMMAPKYQRASVLHNAIESACAELEEPIDKIEVIAGDVLFWAGSQRVRVTYHYMQTYDSNGAPAPGSGTWAMSVGKVVSNAAPMRRVVSVVKALPSFIRKLARGGNGT